MPLLAGLVVVSHLKGGYRPHRVPASASRGRCSSKESKQDDRPGGETQAGPILKEPCRKTMTSLFSFTLSWLSTTKNVTNTYQTMHTTTSDERFVQGKNITFHTTRISQITRSLDKAAPLCWQLNLNLCRWLAVSGRNTESNSSRGDWLCHKKREIQETGCVLLLAELGWLLLWLWTDGVIRDPVVWERWG